MTISRPVPLSLWLFFAGVVASTSRGAPPSATDATRLPDEVPALATRAPRTEAEEDRLTAVALYTHGRLLYDRQDRTGALRKYERAWRYDPVSLTLLNEIVPLALELKLSDEAIRYVLLTPDLKTKDALLLRRLAVQLAERGKWAEALRMFEASVPQQPAETTEINDLSSALLVSEIARLCFLTQQFDRSAAGFTSLRKAIEQPDQHGLNAESVKTVLGNAEQTWPLMAEAFLTAKRYAEATELFRKAHEAKADEARLAFRLARVEAAQQKPAEALKLLEEAFAKKLPAASREPFDLLKQLMVKLSPDADAAQRQYRERLRQLQTEDPANLPLGYALAQALQQAEELPAAESLLETLLAKQPSEIGQRQLVEIQYRQKAWQKLAATLGAVVQRAGTLEPLGEVGKRLVQDEAAVKELLAVGTAQREAKVAEPSGQARALGLFAARAKQFDQAEGCFAAALAEPEADKSQLWFGWGLELFLADEPVRAAEVLQRIIDERAWPANETPVYFYLSSAYELAGKTDESLRAIKQGIARNPNNVRLESRLGWVQYHAKNLPAAETAYREFLARFDKAVDAETRFHLRQARLVLSNVALKLDKFNDAVEYLEQVLDEFPGDPGALNDLGYLWAERGQHLHRALGMTHQAATAEPANLAYRDSLGWAYFQLGRYEEAAREIRLAAQRESAGDGVVLEHLGDVEACLGRSEQAHAAWQRAAASLEKEGDLPRLSAVRAKLAAAP